MQSVSDNHLLIMSNKNGSFFLWFVLTMLTWLGLAGLSDEIVEWQAWFEQGVMQHWRSIKEWVIAILFWWVPFRVPSWLIDYFVVGAIVFRAGGAVKWNENWRYGPERALAEYGYIPLHWRIEWLMSHTLTLSRFPAHVIFVFIWPLAFLMMIAEAIRGRAFSPKITASANEKRRHMIVWLTRIIWQFVGFIPVLFACSTVLYKLG